MSLVQQGTHTARNKKTAISITCAALTAAPTAMVMWNSDAAVLSSTCPLWGSFVCGQR